MTTSHRDLALMDPWQRSLERSLHRRAITPAIRRSLARRKRASVALSTLMVAGPTGSLLAAAGFGGPQAFYVFAGAALLGALVTLVVPHQRGLEEVEHRVEELAGHPQAPAEQEAPTVRG